MKQLTSTVLRRGRRPAKRGAVARVLRRGTLVALSLLVILGIGVGILLLRLSTGPLSFGRWPEQFASAMADRIGPGWTVTFRDSALELQDGSLAVHATGLDIRDPGGALVMRAPHAVVSVDTVSLLSAQFQPRAMEFRDVQLRAVLNPDGSLSFVPAAEPQ